MSGSCGCGCGEDTARRYRPGHDAKHKARLIQDTRTGNAYRRHAAVATLVEMGWGRHIDPTILATTPVRTRYKGRFTETRHVDSLHGVCLDDEGTGHSRWFCPAASSRGTWVKGLAGWLCGVCIHTRDYSETVNSPGYGVTSNAVDLPRYVAKRSHPKRPRNTPRPFPTEAWAALDRHAQADHDRRDPVRPRHATRTPGRSRRLAIPR